MSALKIAAAALVTSGVLHMLAVVSSGIASEALPLVVYALLFPTLAWYLLRNRSRVVAWIVFFMVLLLSIGALGRTGGANPVPDVALYLIVLFDWVSALALAAWLWRDPQSTESSA